MAKALLILFGGRIIPNALTILHEKPDIIVPIVSKDELNKLGNFKKGVDKLLEKKGYDYKWLDDTNADTFTVNPCNKENIKVVCEKIVKNNPSYEWIFNITSGTSIMSIGAYEAAKELIKDISVQCWYLDTANERVVSLLGEARNGSLDEALFAISIDEYATVHNKVLSVNMKEDKLPSEDERLIFAQFLVASHAYIRALRKMLVEKNRDTPSVECQISQQKKNQEQEYYTCKCPLASDEKAVLKMAQDCGLIRNLISEKTSLSFEISSQQFLFLNGRWLELYVCNEVRNIKKDGQPLFREVKTNRLVHNKREQGYNKKPENELDVSMMYNGQLFIIECKAGYDVKEPETIFKLDSVANAFGGGFVGKYLVTGLSKDEIEKQQQTEKSNFQERLEIRKIALITLDDLTKLGNFFKKEAKNPKFPRI
jgi:hypothetical protein